MLSGIIAVLLMLVFVGVWIWAWRPQRKQDFERAARLALDEGTPGHDGDTVGGGSGSDIDTGKPQA